MSGFGAQKRQRIEGDFAYVAPSTSRTAAKAAANSRAQQEQARLALNAQRKEENLPTPPLLSLATLPPASLQRYLNGLLEPQGSLSYHHAVFPVPPLPASLPPPLTGRVLNSRRPKPTLDPSHSDDHLSQSQAQEPTTTTTTRGKKRVWQEPKTPEFADLTAYDDPQTVVNRLASRAKEHWDKRDSVKEGETLTNFIFALRMRAHTLRATPPG